MKLKKKIKRNIIIVIFIVAILVTGYGIYHFFGNVNTIKEVKIVNEIDGYGYKLKDNKSKKYKDMFSKLKKILIADEVDEKQYVKQISQMFIYDFYTLNDKTTKTDVGGVDFIYSTIVNNFLTNAESTYYRYVESDLYNQRKQKLPTVDTISIDNIETTTYEYEKETDDEAYQVDVTWTYTSEDYNSYQQKATLIFVHEDKKLSLVELN